MNLKPLADRIIVKPSTASDVSKGGIFLPDAAQEKSQTGVIVAAGNGRLADDGTLILLSLSVGDTVLYGKYSGTEINSDGEDYLIMRESDVFAVVEEG